MVHRRSWTGITDVEYETLAYVDWFNQRRLHGEIGMVPPAEFEATYFDQSTPVAVAGLSKTSLYETQAVQGLSSCD